jgi:phage tail-like protein
MTAALLPAVPRPPHDPMSWVLNTQAGWRGARLADVEQTPYTGLLALTPLPGSGRLLSEPAGSFGGLALPPNVVIDHCGALYLLDRTQQRVKRFDPCTCRFAVVPFTGGTGTGPREFAAAQTTAACHDRLYIGDPGHHRIQVFALPGFGLRDIWHSPPGLALPWQPVDIAVTFGDRRVLVADAANSAVHLLTAEGRYLHSLDGFGSPLAVAVDCDDRLYVLPRDRDAVIATTLDPPGPRETLQRRDAVSDRFARLPFVVAADGSLQLGAMCDPSFHGGWFDIDGNPLQDPPASPQTVYPQRGTFVSTALDSGLYRCLWDKVVVRAYVPAHCRVRLYTFTAETEQPIDLVLALPSDAWATQQALHATERERPVDELECAVRSQPGRFLWLKLVLESDGDDTPRLDRVRVDFPRISLRRYLPAVFGAEPVSADFTDRLLGIFDAIQRGIEGQLDRQARLFDPLSAPAESRRDFLSWIASWLGVALQRHWPLQRRREYLKRVGSLFKLRGTLPGLRDQLYLYLGLDVADACCAVPAPCGPCRREPDRGWRPPPLILEHFRLRRWLFLGSGRLGDQAMLWGQAIVNRSQLSGEQVEGNAQLGVTQLKTERDPLRDPFHVYAHRFSVFAPSCYARSPQQRKGLERLLEQERPAHTACQIVYVKPLFRIGIQSMIGFDAVVACYSEGYSLDHRTPLGRGTILTAERGADAHPRVGKTTRLT